jgi:threonine/homoserine/homoserine lactone efflux protein
MAAAALGLGALVAASATAFTVLKWVGAAYLVYVGVGMVHAPWRSQPLAGLPPAASLSAPTATMPLRKVFATRVSGPTPSIPRWRLFFLAFVPQFIASATRSTRPLTFLLLGLVFIVNAVAVNLAYGWGAAWLASACQALRRSLACSTAAPARCSFTSESGWQRSERTLQPRFTKEKTGHAPQPIKISPQEALVRTIEHREIFHDEMLHIVRQIMGGDMSPVMMAALITGLRVKKETIGEITAAAQVMREFSTKVHVKPTGSHLVDIVGTGGDGSHTFNISTCSMFVAAAAGAKVSKHGGRSVSSKSGSADVMEALGVNIKLHAGAHCAVHRGGRGRLHVCAQPPSGDEERGSGAQGTGRIVTIFNLLGPLTNPAECAQHPDGGVPSRPGGYPGACAAAPGHRTCRGGVWPRRHGRGQPGGGHHGR